MKDYGNKRQVKFLDSIPTKSLSAGDDDLTLRCKFNFSYFIPTAPGQDFADWDHQALVQLLNKIKFYSAHPLSYWITMPAGSGCGNVYQKYGAFPKKSDFDKPAHIPHDVDWGRFRLMKKVRLVGFTVPMDLHDTAHPKTAQRFCANTFYVVYLDAEHRFWVSEKP